MLFLFSFFLAFFFHRTQAILIRNVTIDDTTGDSLTGAPVTYTPADAWTSSKTCAECPDVKKLFSGTSHTSTFSVNDTKNPNVPLTASVSFNGSAIYVFCALSHTASSPGNPGGDSDMTFYVDGVQVGVFVQPATGSAGFDYSVPVYVNSVLPPGPHTFTLQNGHENGAPSLLVLDEIIYTREDPSDSGTSTVAPQANPSASASAAPQNAHSTAIAVAAVLIFGLAFFLVALGLFLYRRRRHRRAIYARYMPEGAVRAFPASRPLTPMSTAGNSFVATPRAGLATLPPVYAGGGLGGGGGNGGGNWWVGRDQKSRAGGPTHRPYADLDPASGGLQRPQGWEHTSRSRNHSFDSGQF